MVVQNTQEDALRTLKKYHWFEAELGEWHHGSQGVYARRKGLDGSWVPLSSGEIVSAKAALRRLGIAYGTSNGFNISQESASKLGLEIVTVEEQKLHYEPERKERYYGRSRPRKEPPKETHPNRKPLGKGIVSIEELGSDDAAAFASLLSTGDDNLGSGIEQKPFLKAAKELAKTSGIA